MTGRKSKKKTSSPTSDEDKSAAAAPRLFTLKVLLLSGYIDDDEEDVEISRTIQILGDQTLDDLHQAIFDAFDRDDEHLYEFQFGKKPQDKNATRFITPDASDMFDGEHYAGISDEITLDSLELKKRSKFFYLFDFGDDLRHKITVESIDVKPSRGKFPKVTERTGKSPPQYPIFDE